MSLLPNDQDQPGTAQNLPQEEAGPRDSAASACYLRFLTPRDEAVTLKFWHPGNLDLTNPFAAFEGKTIVKTDWLPGGVDFEFSDGSHGTVDLMMHKKHFDASVGTMITNGELYVTAAVWPEGQAAPTIQSVLFGKP